jgi:hypothetical protein
MSLPKLIYWGFRTRCSKQKLLAHVQKRVAQENLADVVSHIRIEKGIGNGEYYFYLGIRPMARPDWEDTQSYLKQRLPTILAEIPKAFEKNFLWEDIRHMVGIAYDLEGDTQPMKYWPASQPLKVNLLTLEIPIAESAESDRSQACERLLWWLSAAGSGSWETFQAACEHLSIPQPRRLLRRLQLLGHLTVTPDGKRWQMQPSSLQPVGENRYVLYGQRNRGLVQALSGFGKLTAEQQPNGNAPPCWQWEPHDLDKVLPILQTSYPALAMQKVTLPPSWAEWQAACAVVDGVPYHRYQMRRFDGVGFVDLPNFNQETGFYELREEKTGQQHALFYDREKDAWYSGEWYGLRFWALTCLFPGQLSVQCDAQSLKIPLKERWPLAYERYLVMQSGFLPEYDRIGSTLGYRNISRDVAQAVTTLL